jgi:carboxymethylenebutenolidase
MGQMIQFLRTDGPTVSGYFAEATAAAGSLLVLQEWWGLNEQIRGVADRFAVAGFTTLVPDLYRGKRTVHAQEAHHRWKWQGGRHWLFHGRCAGDAINDDGA